MQELTEEDIQGLYSWIDVIPITRPKRNITRDFSDGVATAEVIHHFIPKIVELHNYSPASAAAQKLYNWNTLNQKVFKKIGYNASDELIQSIVQTKPGYIELLLFELRTQIERYLQNKQEKGHLKLRSYEESNTPLNISYWENSNHIQLNPETMNNYHQIQPQHHTIEASAAHQNNQQHAQLLSEIEAKDRIIKELSETVQILLVKISKLEQILELKDKKFKTQR